MSLKKKVKVLLNPSSGGGYSLKKINKVKKKLKSLNYSWHMVVSDSEEHFREEALAEEDNILLVAGGDSSLVIAIEELIKQNNIDITLAFMPLGSANDIGRALKIKNISSAIQALNKGKKIKLDIINVKINHKGDNFYFLGSLSFGLGSEINKYITQNMVGKNKNLTLFYAVKGGYKAFSSLRVPLKYYLVSGKEKKEINSSLGLLLNSPYYANGLDFSQKVSLNGNHIDFFSFNNKSFFSALTSFISFKFKKNCKNLTHFKGEEFYVDFSSPNDIQLDGEIIENVNSFSVKKLKERITLYTL